ncbi:hypothetical protein BpHYR1_012733 [Brachionus plicatilis]|uniref:Uncharacterized protein n=1 Tax=Brachionus plicatilis TaxID=10195 RepID=A0A3M7T1L9_BRAPC|nr:hypothetical protein BpHYR1_012733 [Brachionus plicatilis]
MDFQNKDLRIVVVSKIFNLNKWKQLCAAHFFPVTSCLLFLLFDEMIHVQLNEGYDCMIYKMYQPYLFDEK